MAACLGHTERSAKGIWAPLMERGSRDLEGPRLALEPHFFAGDPP